MQLSEFDSGLDDKKSTPQKQNEKLHPHRVRIIKKEEKKNAAKNYILICRLHME